jgi:hypothetical protein
MPSVETVERFVKRVEENAHAEAIEEFYTEQASIQENQESPRVGRDSLVAGERKMLAKVKKLSSQCVRPVFIQGDHVVIRWKFRFEWLNGTVTMMEEIAYQHWEDEQIASEMFFYDPAQRTPV